MDTIRSAAILLLGCAASWACAQDKAPENPPAQPKPGAPGQPGEIPPALKLGLRVDQVRRKLAVAPVVVVVKDVSSYVEAIGMWRLTVRFPVLIDDGAPASRENIGRFVRAFRPKQVLRWSSGKKTMHEWGAEPAVIDAAVGRAWTADGAAPEKGFDQAAVLAQWKTLQLAPPGVVAAAKDDPAWPAAVALAAGRGQPIFWTTSTRRLDNSANPGEVDGFCRDLEAFCDSTGLSWKSLGDTLEAVTICTAMPQTYKGPQGTTALTDRVGRTSKGDRWGWAGQIFGLGAPASYRAMCSLFLTSERKAWIFDSYPDSAGWNDFDGRKAEEILKQVGWTCTTIGKPDGTLDSWRREARKPIAAELLLVNTKGEKDAFHLASGSGKPSDLPVLNRPAVVHFVHSFSCQFVGTRDTLGGRWLDRGAYAYAGSVDEPGLTGFIPTPIMAAREASQFPFGAAARYDNAPVWRITVIGDPLTTFGPPGGEAPVPTFPGAVDLAEEVKVLIKTDLAEGTWDLILLGRDEDAARLGAAMAGSPPAGVKPDAALPAALALFRTGKLDAFRTLVGMLKPADLAKHPEVQDVRGIVGAK